MASKTARTRTSCESKSAKRVEDKRAAFRAWLTALANGAKAPTPANRLYLDSQDPQTQRTALTWRTLCEEPGAMAQHSAIRNGVDWRVLAPPL